jgi:putative acetyltransferase
MLLRPIEQKDNNIIAEIIRNTLLEFGAAKPGTMYYDDSVFTTYEHFQPFGNAYFVCEIEGTIVGGGGIAHTVGLPSDIVELARVYLLPDARGKGIGKTLILHCETIAKTLGYRKIYLETTHELKIAIPLYEKLGYQYIEKPLVDTGHYGCGIRMLKTL